MKKLQLMKGLSYSTMKVSAVKGVPFSIEDDVAEILMKTGRFEEMPEEDDTVVGGTEAPKHFADMTKAELETFAAANNIDLRGCKSKADMLAKASTFAGNAAEGKIDFGSPTMEELQE